MRRPFLELHVHLVWATWDRLPLLNGDLRRVVFADLCSEARKVNAEVLAVGGMADHVHLLARIPATLSIAELAKRVKGGSSHLVTHGTAEVTAFKWQGGYGAFAVSRWDVPKIRNYVLNQEEHHTGSTLLDDLETIHLLD